MLAILSQLASALAVSFWGRLCDRTSNKTVIALCAPLFLCCPFGWVLAAAPAAPSLSLAVVLVLQLVLGVAMAGLDLAGGNIALKLAPRGEATVFLGANGFVKSLCAGCAPMMGGLIIDRLPSLALGSSAAQPWPAFFVATGLFGIVALVRLARIEEAGDVRLGMLFASARKGFMATRQAARARNAGAADRPAQDVVAQTASRLAAFAPPKPARAAQTLDPVP
jgi:MFS family permease